MQKFQIYIVIIFLALLGTAFSNTSKEVQFLSGYIILSSKASMPDSVKARKFIELEKITSVTTQEAIGFINKYRNNPEEWKQVEDLSTKLMTRKEVQPNNK